MKTNNEHTTESTIDNKNKNESTNDKDINRTSDHIIDQALKQLLQPKPNELRAIIIKNQELLKKASLLPKLLDDIQQALLADTATMRHTTNLRSAKLLLARQKNFQSAMKSLRQITKCYKDVHRILRLTPMNLKKSAEATELQNILARQDTFSKILTALDEFVGGQNPAK